MVKPEKLEALLEKLVTLVVLVTVDSEFEMIVLSSLESASEGW